MRGILGAVLASSLVLATGLFGSETQAPDEIRVGDQTYFIATEPLASFLEQHPDALPSSEVVSSYNWRGYIATWRLADDKLLLEDVRMMTIAAADPRAPADTQWRSVLEVLFPKGGPQQATWFSGYLIVPTGTLQENVRLGYKLAYSTYLVARVEKGAVTSQREMDWNAFQVFRGEQFAKFKTTPAFGQLVEHLRSLYPQKTAKEHEDHLFEFGTPHYLYRIGDEGADAARQGPAPPPDKV